MRFFVYNYFASVPFDCLGSRAHTTVLNTIVLVLCTHYWYVHKYEHIDKWYVHQILLQIDRFSTYLWIIDFYWLLTYLLILHNENIIHKTYCAFNPFSHEINIVIFVVFQKLSCWLWCAGLNIQKSIPDNSINLFQCDN